MTWMNRVPEAPTTPAICLECGARFRIPSPERTYICRGCGGEVEASAKWASMPRGHTGAEPFGPGDGKLLEKRIARASTALKAAGVIGFFQFGHMLDLVDRTQAELLERLESPRLPLPLVVESAITYLVAGLGLVVAARFRHGPGAASGAALFVGLGSVATLVLGAVLNPAPDPALQGFRAVFALLVFSTCFPLALDRRRIQAIRWARQTIQPPPGSMARVAIFFGVLLMFFSLMAAFRFDESEGAVDVLRGVEAYGSSGDPADFDVLPDHAFRIREAFQKARSRGAWGGPGAPAGPGYLGTLDVEKSQDELDCRWTAEDGTLTSLQLSKSGEAWSVDRCFVRLASERTPARRRPR